MRQSPLRYVSGSDIATREVRKPFVACLRLSSRWHALSAPSPASNVAGDSTRHNSTRHNSTRSPSRSIWGCARRCPSWLCNGCGSTGGMRYCGRGAGRWSAAVPADRLCPVDVAHFEPCDRTRVFEHFRRSFRGARRGGDDGPRRTRRETLCNVLVDHHAVTDIDRSRRAAVGSHRHDAHHRESDYDDSGNRDRRRAAAAFGDARVAVRPSVRTTALSRGLAVRVVRRELARRSR